MKYFIKTIAALFLVLGSCSCVSKTQEEVNAVPKVTPLTDSIREAIREGVWTSYDNLGRIALVPGFLDNPKTIGDSLYMFMCAAIRNRPDTMLLHLALEMSNRTDESRLDWKERNTCLYQRMEILALLGRCDEAFATYKKTYYSETSPLQLRHRGLMALNENKMDSAGIYFSKQIEVCGKMLAEKFNPGMAMDCIAATYFLHGEDEEKNLLNSYLNKYPDDEILKLIERDWNENIINFEYLSHLHDYYEIMHEFMQQPSAKSNSQKTI